MVEKHTLHPSFKRLYGLLVVLLIACIMLTAALYFLIQADVSNLVFIPLVIVFLAAVMIVIYTTIYTFTYTYYFSAEEVAVEKGIFSKVTRSVPVANIDNLTVRRSILGRVFGFGDICVDTPGGSGYELVMGHIEAKALDEVVFEMKQHMAATRGGIKRNL